MSMPLLKNISIRYKLLLCFIVILIPITLFGGIATYYILKQTIQTQIENELTNTTESIMRMVKTSTTVSIRNRLRAIAEKNLDIVEHFYLRYQEGALTWQEMLTKIREILMTQRIGRTGYIYCIDSQGNTVIHPNGGVENRNFAHIGFVREQMERKDGYLEYEWKNPGEPNTRPKALYMIYFAPLDWIISVTAYRNEFRQLIDIDDFRENVLAFRFGQSGYCYIWDVEGNIIVHPVLKKVNVFDSVEYGQSSLRDMIKQKNGRMVYSWKNPGETSYRDKLVVFRYLEKYKWIIASSCYIDEVFKPLQTVRHLTIAATAGSLCFIVLITMGFSTYFTAPIIRLSHLFTEGARGDLTVRMNYSADDELGKMSNYFNRFMDYLQMVHLELTEEVEERARAEQRLKEREAELDRANQMLILVLDTIPVRVFWKDKSQKYLGCNRLFAGDFGVNHPSEVIGKSDGEMLSDGEQAEIYQKEDLEIITARQPKLEYEAFETMASGQRLWINVTKIPLFDDEQQIIGLLGVYDDITEQKNSDWEKRKLKALLTNIINSMPSVLIGVDARRQVTLWNREAEKYTGVSSQEAEGRLLTEVFPLFAREIPKIDAALDKRVPQSETHVPYVEENETRFTDVTVFPLLTDYEEGAVIRIDDVTGRVRMEEMMIQSEKMVSVGGLAAGMAHEINNPLAGIMNNIQVIRNRVIGRLPKNRSAAADCGIDMASIRNYMEKRGVLKMIDAVSESGKRASLIVNNMLSFSRKSASRLMSNDMAELMDKTLELACNDYDLKKQYDFRHILIVREYEKNMPPVLCDENLIQQVFFNILKNGAQAMAEIRDTVGKEPRFILRIGAARESAVIEIEDNGPGMAEAVRKRIFEPFYTTKDIGIGTGLGLSVSFFIITENHGGTMGVESHPGIGTKFVIHLPFRPCTDGLDSSAV